MRDSPASKGDWDDKRKRRDSQMTTKRVLSIGQCGADHAAIARAIQRSFGAEVVPAGTSAEAFDLLLQEPFDLVLVNRVFDWDGADGIAMVKQIKADEKLRHVPVMLVSNYDDAQQLAVEAGALPGFGKAALGMPSMTGQLKPFLTEARPAAVSEGSP
jgi:CheY-like chemotaxis protein